MAVGPFSIKLFHSNELYSTVTHSLTSNVTQQCITSTVYYQYYHISTTVLNRVLSVLTVYYLAFPKVYSESESLYFNCAVCQSCSRQTTDCPEINQDVAACPTSFVITLMKYCYLPVEGNKVQL